VRATTKESAELAHAMSSAENMIISSSHGAQLDLTIDPANTYARSMQSLEKKGHAYRLELLSKMYKKSKKKAKELDEAGGSSAIPLKVHVQQGGKIFNAISTLLYASISAAKVDDLESYIRKKGATLPASVYDASKWQDVIDVARSVRTQNYGTIEAIPNAATLVTESTMNMGFEDTGGIPSTINGRTTTSAMMVRPHTAGGMYSGNMLEEDDFEQTGGIGMERGVGAQQNNWMSPGKTLPLGGMRPHHTLEDHKSKMTKRRMSDVTNSHSILKNSARESFDSFAKYLETVSVQIVHSVKRHQKEALDTHEAQSMRCEQLELDLERSRETLENEMSKESAAQATQDAAQVKTMVDSGKVPPKGWGKVVHDQHFVTDAHDQLIKKFNEISAEKESDDKALEAAKERVSHLEARLGDLQEALALSNASAEAATAKAEAADLLAAEAKDGRRADRELVESLRAELAKEQDAVKTAISKAEAHEKENTELKHVLTKQASAHTEAIAQVESKHLKEVLRLQKELKDAKNGELAEELAKRAEAVNVEGEENLPEEAVKAFKLRISAMEKENVGMCERLSEAVSKTDDMNGTIDELELKVARLEDANAEIEQCYGRAKIAVSQFQDEIEYLRKNALESDEHKRSNSQSMIVGADSQKRLEAQMSQLRMKHEKALATAREELHREREALMTEERRMARMRDKLHFEESRTRKLSVLLTAHGGDELTHLTSLAMSGPTFIEDGTGNDEDTKTVEASEVAKQKEAEHARQLARRTSMSIIGEGSFSLAISGMSPSASPSASPNKKALPSSSASTFNASNSDELIALKKKVAHYKGTSDVFEDEVLGVRRQVVELKHTTDTQIKNLTTVNEALIVEKKSLNVELDEQRELVKVLEAELSVFKGDPSGEPDYIKETQSSHETHVSMLSSSNHVTQKISEKAMHKGHHKATQKVQNEKHYTADQVDLSDNSHNAAAAKHPHKHPSSPQGPEAPTHEALSALEEELLVTKASLATAEKNLQKFEDEKSEITRTAYRKINHSLDDAKEEMEREKENFRTSMHEKETALFHAKSDLGKMEFKIRDLEKELTSARDESRELDKRNKDLIQELEQLQNKEAAAPQLFKLPSVGVEEEKDDSAVEIAKQEEEEARKVKAKVAAFVAHDGMASKRAEGTAANPRNRVALLVPGEEDPGHDDDNDEAEDTVAEMSNNAHSPGSRNTRSILARGTSLGSMQEQSIVRIQRLVRGFLARVLVGHLEMEKNAERSGIMVAYRGSGTQQGEAGWYVCNNELFYFALDKGEFVLVCGPLTELEYDIALDECHNKNIQPRPRYAGEIEIDRIGIVALRVEIARFKRKLAEAEHRAGPFGPTSCDLAAAQSTIAAKEKEIKDLHVSLEDTKTLVSNEKEKVEKQVRLAGELRKRIKMLQVELTTAKDALHTGRGSGGANYNNYAVMTSRHASSGAVASDYVAKIASMNLTSKTTFGIITIQAVIRGFIVRSKTSQTKRYTQASKEGVLMALKGTTQGQSGWYRTPEGPVYFFTLKDEQWVITAGPLTMNGYHDLFYAPRQNAIMSGTPQGTPHVTIKKEIVGGRRRTVRKKKSTEASIQAHTLLKANCELQVVHPDFTGDLFVDRASKNLFVAISVEQLVLESNVVVDED
jgi:hypothetical protein